MEEKSALERLRDFVSAVSDRLKAEGYRIEYVNIDDNVVQARIRAGDHGLIVTAKETWSGDWKRSRTGRLTYSLDIPLDGHSRGIRSKAYPEPKKGFSIDLAVERFSEVDDELRKIKKDRNDKEAAWEAFYEAYFNEKPKGPAARDHKAVSDGGIAMVSRGKKVRVSFLCSSDEKGAKIAKKVAYLLAKEGILDEDG